MMIETQNKEVLLYIMMYSNIPCFTTDKRQQFKIPRPKLPIDPYHKLRHTILRIPCKDTA